VLIDPDDIGLVLDAHRGLFLPIDLELTIARWDTVRRPRSIPDCRDAASACFEYPSSGPYQLFTTRRRPMTFLNSSLRLTSCGCKSPIFCGIGRLWKIEGRRYDPDTVARLHFDFELAAPRRSIGRREYPIDADAGTPVVEAGYVELRHAIRGEFRGVRSIRLKFECHPPAFPLEKDRDQRPVVHRSASPFSVSQW